MWHFPTCCLERVKVPYLDCKFINRNWYNSGFSIYTYIHVHCYVWPVFTAFSWCRTGRTHFGTLQTAVGWRAREPGYDHSPGTLFFHGDSMTRNLLFSACNQWRFATHFSRGGVLVELGYLWESWAPVQGWHFFLNASWCSSYHFYSVYLGRNSSIYNKYGDILLSSPNSGHIKKWVG